MTSSAPLQGTNLIDCAKANAKKDIETVSERCGYGQDLATFEQALKEAYNSIGVEIQGFADIKEKQTPHTKQQGIEIAPETSTQF